MGLKHLVRPLVDRFAAWSGVMDRLEAGLRGQLTILTYHRVLPDELCRSYPLSALVIPLSAFREQLIDLRPRYRVLPVGEALRELELGNSGRPLLSLTFDDGYLDNQHRVPHYQPSSKV